MDSLFHQFLGGTFGGLHILLDITFRSTEPEGQRADFRPANGGGAANQTKGGDGVQSGEIGKLATGNGLSHAHGSPTERPPSLLLEMFQPQAIQTN